MVDEDVLLDLEVVVEEVEELLLHQVDFGEREERRIPRPVLVLWRSIVEVLGSTDEGGEEDSVASAVHALGDSRQLVLQPLEVDERDEEGGRLDVGVLDKEGDERLQTGETRVLDLGGSGGLVDCLLLSSGRVRDAVGGGLGRGGGWRRERRRGLVDDDDRASFGGDVDDLLLCDGLLHELEKLDVVVLLGDERRREVEGGGERHVD